MITINQDKFLLKTEHTGEPYSAGFHVFLDKKCAEAYLNSIYGNHNYYVCGVLYNTVTSIGFNGGDDYMPLKTPSHGLCVIANQLVILSNDWKKALDRNP